MSFTRTADARRRMVFILVVTACLTGALSTASGGTVPDTVTFQGFLSRDGEAVTGTAALKFTLFPSAEGGVALWTQTLPGLSIREGLYTAALGPFGALSFDGSYWLEVSVDGVALSPRYPLLSVPYALRAGVADHVAPNAIDADAVADGSLTGADLADGSLGSAEVADGSLTSADIAPSIVSSVAGITNDGGNIDLVAGANVTITADDAAKTITISAAGGDDPGGVTAVEGGDGLAVQNPGGPTAVLHVGAGRGISVHSDAVSVDSTWADARYVNAGEAHSISPDMIQPGLVRSVEGVSTDSGNIDLIPGANIVITADDASDAITISAEGAGTGDVTDVLGGAGIFTVDSTGPQPVLSIVGGEGIEVKDDGIAVDTTWADQRYVNVGEIVAGEGDVTAVLGGNGLAAEQSDGPVPTLSIGQGNGLNVTADAVGIADGGVGPSQIADGAVTTAKLSATGGSNGQVLKHNGSAVYWGADELGGLTLPYTGTASTPTLSPLLDLTNTGAGVGVQVHTNGTSLACYSTNGYAVHGESDTPFKGAIHGVTTTAAGAAVTGENEVNNTTGALGGDSGAFGSATAGHGVRGWTSAHDHAGIHGTATMADGQGVYGTNSANSNYGYIGGTYGVYGKAVSAVNGIQGEATSASNAGVYGTNSASGGYGVMGNNSDTNNYGYLGGAYGAYGWAASNHGVYGASGGADKGGIYGSSSSGTGYGVYGRNSNTNGYGVYGKNTSSTAYGYLGGHVDGVYGYAYGSGARAIHGKASCVAPPPCTDFWAGYFEGMVKITGQLNAGSNMEVGGFLYVDYDVTGYRNLNISGTKNFRIDHPLDPEHKYLFHAATESNEALNQYSGNVTLSEAGEARVDLPDWFGAINTDFRYQLTCIGGFAPVYVADEIRANHFRIAGGTPGLKVSWQVTARRSDLYMQKYPFEVEQDKPAEEQGKYNHPELYGLPENDDASEE